LPRRLAGLMLVAALIGAAGCSREPSAGPPEPFGDFAVGQFGGVAGLQEILRVRADGNAVLIAREPASGRFTQEEMGRLRTLLTSEEFRLEVARELEGKRKPRKVECSDQIITEVSMGSLSLSRSGPCGKEDLPDAPVFDEILTIVGPARRGDFAGPVDGSEPRLVPIRLERLATASRSGYLITIDRRGAGSITTEGAAARRAEVGPADRDTLRLLLPPLTSAPITPCQSTEYYRVRIESATPVSASDCEFRRSNPEFRALVTVVETAFGVS